MDKAIFQNRVKGHTDGLDMERWYVRKRGVKKGSLLEDSSGWWVILLRWSRVETMCKWSQLYLNQALKIKKKKNVTLDMIRGWLMEKWLRGTFIVSSTSSSTIAVMPPRFQVTESMKKHFEVSTFHFTHYFLWPFAHLSALWFHTLASDPPAWFWEITYPFSDLLLSFPSESLLCILPWSQH